MQNIRSIKKLPSVDEIIQAYPLSKSLQEQVDRDRQDVKNILAGKDSRFLLITGPCSAWPSDAVLEYARRLKQLDAEVNHALKLVLRVYIQKPRTTMGWTGPVNQPDPFAPADIAAGAMYARKLMVDAIAMGLPIADEALFTHNAQGFIELLSWVAIGARSTEDQEHRIFASSIDAPVGLKNPTSGSIPIGINSVIAAQHPHTAVFDSYQVETLGNPYAHLVLRGGELGPNFHLDKLYQSRELLRNKKVSNPAVIVDASHENSRINGGKDPEFQSDVIREVLHNLRVHPELADTVKGFMLESFIQAGRQELNSLTPDTIDLGGLSVTDPCMGWDSTETLIRETADMVARLKP